MSGLKNKQEEQPKEHECACNGLVLEMLQAMTAQSKVIESQGQQITMLISAHASQNELLCKIVDQNNELIAMNGIDEDGETKSRYLDE